MPAVRNYLSSLSQAFGAGWNRFWFTPSDAYPLSVIRICTGLAALYYVVSQTGDLLRWFGPDGLLSIDSVYRLSGEGTSRLSLLFLAHDSTSLWAAHALACGVLAAFTVGLFTRWTSVLALVAVLSYVNRAPLLAGQFEPVLTMVLAYLCLTPAGAHLSVDRWRRQKRQLGELSPSVAANIGLRLIQLHTAGFVLLSGLTMLAGQPWWNGEGLWYLIAHTESRWLDLSALQSHTYVINLWTHLTVGSHLVFGLLIWNQLARPLLLGLLAAVWTSLALVTGLLAFYTMLLIACLAFVSPQTLRRVC